VFDSSTTNPIDLEIRWQRLIAVMDEVDTATVKTSFSTIVGESRDFACILLDPRGASLCQSSFSPPDFCVSITRTSRAILDRFPLASLEPGDVLVTNDPWLGDGHLPDYFVLSPVFHRGRVVAILGTVAHVADVGGHPGDIVATDVFTEGVRVPPAKLYQAGRENRLLFEVIGGNCRVPEMVLGDLRAIVGTHQVGARRLVEFLEDERLDDLDALAREIHGRSEALMRDRIEAWPDGRYEFGLDIDGYLQPVHLHATVVIAGRDVVVDYAGTSREVEGAAINCTYNTTRSSTMYPFKCALVPGVPNNEGLFAPIRVVAPEGCILNTTLPAPGQRPRQDDQQHQPGALRRPLARARRARPSRLRQHLALQRERPDARARRLQRARPAARRARRDARPRRHGADRLPPQQRGHAGRDLRVAVPRHDHQQGAARRLRRRRPAPRRPRPGDDLPARGRRPHPRPRAAGQDPPPGPGPRGRRARRDRPGAVQRPSS
jgi:hypothetical protein